MKQRFLLLLLLWFWLATVACKCYKRNITRITKIEKRTWGGMSANTGSNNYGGWLVRIRSGGIFTVSCGGSYVSPLLVLSSANCIHPIRFLSAGVNVVTTANAADEEFNFAEVDTFYTPHDFHYLKTKMDIALVRLHVPLHGRLTEFIKLSTSWPTTDMVMHTFGWGWDSLEVQAPTSEPRTVLVTFIEYENCVKLFQRHFVADTIMCVRQPKDKYKCIYDSGSPLVLGNELVGIASVGSTCMNTSVPGLYTNINKVMPFITQIQEGIKAGRFLSSTKFNLFQLKLSKPIVKTKRKILNLK